MKYQNPNYILFFSILIFGLVFSFGQKKIPPKPSIQTSVYDNASLFTSSEKNRLENKLISYADSTGTQIVVATIKSLEGEYINLYATEWAHSWGIGQKGNDNGIFILVSDKDRKMYISTGYGVEHLLTDALSRRIIETVIVPEFRNSSYYKGIDKGTDVIINVMNGEYTAPERIGNEDFNPILIFIIFFVILFLLSKSKRGNGNHGGRGRGMSPLDVIIFSNMGRGGNSGSGGFGGGGFGGGFGGGGFGGGGAGGSW